MTAPTTDVDLAQAAAAITAAQAALTSERQASAAQLAQIQAKLATALAADVADKSALTAALATVAALQAQLAGQPPSDPVTLHDFAGPNNTGRAFASALAGQGVGRTVYSMLPMTSTKANLIPAPGVANPLFLLAVGGGVGAASGVVQGLDVHDFTLQGTPQGHVYGGLVIGKSLKGHVHDVAIAGIPGSDSTPPGETGALATYLTQQLLVERVAVDGHDQGGVMVSATGFLLNRDQQITLVDCVSRYVRYSHAFALWHVNGATITRPDCRNSRDALNFEDCTGPIVIDTPDLRGTATPHVRIAAEGGNTATYTIINPTTDTGVLDVHVTDYNGKACTQNTSTIHVLDAAGKDITADPTKVKLHVN